MTKPRQHASNTERKAVFPTDLGWMTLIEHAGFARLLSIGHSSQRSALAVARREAPDAPDDTWPLVDRLIAYAEGAPDDFRDVPVQIDAPTPLRRRILEVCRAIPRGATATYAELAAKAGRPGAARAVGTAMSTNRLAILIPCHRVVRSDGGLGGYSGGSGLPLKLKLLELESLGFPAGLAVK